MLCYNFSLLNLRYIFHYSFLWNYWVHFLKSWTSTSYFSNSTGSSVNVRWQVPHQNHWAPGVLVCRGWRSHGKLLCCNKHYQAPKYSSAFVGRFHCWLLHSYFNVYCSFIKNSTKFHYESGDDWLVLPAIIHYQRTAETLINFWAYQRSVRLIKVVLENLNLH